MVGPRSPTVERALERDERGREDDVRETLERDDEERDWVDRIDDDPSPGSAARPDAWIEYRALPIVIHCEPRSRGMRIFIWMDVVEFRGTDVSATMCPRTGTYSPPMNCHTPIDWSERCTSAMR